MSVAIIAGSARGAREHIQRIGRVLRPAEGKRAVAYELVTLDTMDEARTRARRLRLAPRCAGRGARRAARRPRPRPAAAAHFARERRTATTNFVLAASIATMQP
ncbi:MAG TPA: hypothetical protein VFY93_17810, partial [Planctomycetota bacterium]|nr:hypothetical protein [Planctomycetota bacterium]